VIWFRGLAFEETNQANDETILANRRRRPETPTGYGRAIDQPLEVDHVWITDAYVSLVLQGSARGDAKAAVRLTPFTIRPRLANAGRRGKPVEGVYAHARRKVFSAS
jgi:hypothetical protein